MPTDHTAPPSTPRDPRAFRSEVLRRAARLDRRRRVTRAAGWVIGLVAVTTSSLALLRVTGRDDRRGAASRGGALAVTTFEVRRAGRPWSIVAGSDGALWCTVQADGGRPDGILRITPLGDQSLFPLAEGSGPAGIVAGSDGALWFTEPGRGLVGRISTAGVLREFPVGSRPGDAITLGPDGAVWFAEPEANRLAKLTPAGGLTTVPLGPGRHVGGLATGPDGDVWFSEPDATAVGRVAPTGALSEVQLPDRVTAIAAGPGPAIWFALAGPMGSRLAYLSAAGQVVVEAARGTPTIAAIGLAGDGRLWFSGPDASTIDTAGGDGLRSEAISHPAHLDSVTSGPDSAMWAVDRTTGTVMRIELP